MIGYLLALALLGVASIVWMLWRMEYACHKKTMAERDHWYAEYRAQEECRAFEVPADFARPMSLHTGYLKTVEAVPTIH